MQQRLGEAQEVARQQSFFTAAGHPVCNRVGLCGQAHELFTSHSGGHETKQQNNPDKDGPVPHDLPDSIGSRLAAMLVEAVILAVGHTQGTVQRQAQQWGRAFVAG